MENAIEHLQLAISAINAAIDELYNLDGMEQYCEDLNAVAVSLEDELAELESLEAK
jgi:hypothetical protein